MHYSTATLVSTLLSTMAAAQTYSASFTYYGQGDSFGSANCQTTTASCGFYTSPGFSAAASQALFGASSGIGPACDTCYSITGDTYVGGGAIDGGGKTIVVKINNLCPANGNPLCSQADLTQTNEDGANVNLDLCKDSGAADAFFGSNLSPGVILGTAMALPDCSTWTGTNVY